jgi:hypothetical protein
MAVGKVYFITALLFMLHVILNNNSGQSVGMAAFSLIKLLFV